MERYFVRSNINWDEFVLSLADSTDKSFHVFQVLNDSMAITHSWVVKLLLLRKTSPFHKAVLEIDALLEIPPELSMLKEVDVLQ